MKYTYEFDSAINIGRICVNENIYLPKDADELKLFACDFFAEYGCRYFLFDMRQADIHLRTVDAFVIGAPQGEIAQSLRLFNVAVIVQEITKDLGFFENVAVNRGFNVHVFDDIDKAIKWLKPPSCTVKPKKH